MPNLPIQTAKNTRKDFLKAYGACIRAIIDLLKKSRLDFIDLTYDILEPRCYNVSNISGEYGASLIVKVSLDKGSGGLTAYDVSGTEFPLGKDENGQDNYTLSNPDILLRKVTEYIEHFQKHCQITCSKYSSTALQTAIKNFIGKDGNFAFEHGFPRPRLQNNEVVVQITSKEVQTHTPDDKKEPHWFWLKGLKTRELKVLVDAINEYMLFCHNKA